MNQNKLWMVRAGSGAFLVEEFLSKNIVSIGWNAIGDISSIENLQQLKERFREEYPNDKEGRVISSASQLFKFCNEFKKEDCVVTYDPSERIYSIGEITSEYQFDENKCQYFHTRDIKWFHKVYRDDLSISTRNSLGSTLTIFSVPEQARQELFSYLSKEPLSRIDEQINQVSSDTLEKDLIENSHEFIKDKVLTLDPYEMEELTAGLLRAMGYKTRISAKGPDLGKDIIASRDGLGLEDPKIIVEVKHRKNKMGGPDIRSFLGGLRASCKGLYISTGGFSKDAQYEAERATIPLTLVDLDLLVNFIVQHYDTFDLEAKALIPLKKIYWPI